MMLADTCTFQKKEKAKGKSKEDGQKGEASGQTRQEERAEAVTEGVEQLSLND